MLFVLPKVIGRQYNPSPGNHKKQLKNDCFEGPQWGPPQKSKFLPQICDFRAKEYTDDLILLGAQKAFNYRHFIPGTFFIKMCWSIGNRKKSNFFEKSWPPPTFVKHCFLKDLHTVGNFCV